MKFKTILFSLVMSSSINLYSQIGIGTTSPDLSTVLDVNSSNKGVLLPRLTSNQRNVIENPAKGLLIFNTTENCIQVNYGSPDKSIWRCTNDNQNNDVKVIGQLSGFKGEIVNGENITSSLFHISFVNNKFNDVGLTLSNQDLLISGVEGVEVLNVSEENIWLPVGDTIGVDYILSGTPSEIGVITGIWGVKSMNFIDNYNVSNGDADFETINEYYIASFTDTTLNVNHQGIIDNSLNRLTVKIPYKNGRGSYEAYTGEYVRNFDNTGENHEFNKFRISYPSGTFTSNGYLDVTIEVDGDQNFNVLKLFAAQEKEIVRLDLKINENYKGDIIVKSTGGIPDRNFQDTEHRFIYTPVIALDGRTWLSHDLGANYANIYHPNFNPSKRITTYSDVNAYGSLFQWGRFSDGHEIIDYLSNGYGEGKFGDTNLIAASHLNTDSLFIKSSGNWTSSSTLLWQGEAGINNPCPEGYRVPTSPEINNLLSLENITNIYSGSSSILGLSSGGYRVRNTGEIRSESLGGYYWTSTINSTGSSYLKLSSNKRINKGTRSIGYKCRCIKD